FFSAKAGPAERDALLHATSDASAAQSTSAGDPRAMATELSRLLAASVRPLVAIGLGIDPANASRLRAW
ncbi:hypothetical protein ACQ7B2_28030, partial [Escherichia coli]